MQSESLKVGIAQIRSGADPYLNLLLVRSFIDEAIAQGCDLVCFPENVLYRGPKKTEEYTREEAFLDLDEKHRIVADSSFATSCKELLENLPITISLGSVFQKGEEASRPFNSHWILHPSGQVEAYQKIHLFDFQSSAGVYRESLECSPGRDPKVVTVNGWRVGLSICYDLRFPELFRKMALQEKAELLLIPAAFTRTTGQAHWHTLQRARAIENLSFVVAPGQWGTHVDSKGQELFCYGHSLAVSPWGEILADGPDEGDALLVVELHKEELNKYRSQLPALQSVRLS